VEVSLAFKQSSDSGPGSVEIVSGMRRRAPNEARTAQECNERGRHETYRLELLEVGMLQPTEISRGVLLLKPVFHPRIAVSVIPIVIVTQETLSQQVQQRVTEKSARPGRIVTVPIK